MHRYVIMRTAMIIGSFLFMSWVQPLTLRRPTLPTIIQLGFFAFWIFNASLNLIENIFVITIVMLCVGGLYGTDYTNFLYLANAKLELDCDMGLHYYERELTVNMLLLASDIGYLIAVDLT